MLNENIPGRVSLRTIADLIIIVGFVTVLTGIHYSSYHYSVDYHILFQFAYYIPVIYAAIRFGTWGGIGCGLIITFLFLPFMMDSQRVMSREARYTQWVELLLINGFGWFTGFLIEQERRAARGLEKTLEVKELLVEKLKLEAQERQRLEEEVRRSERLTALGQLSTGLAHEIRNPLGIIRVTTQLLADEKRDDPTTLEYCKVLQEETNRLNRMLTDFLDFARPKEPNRQVFYLGKLVQEGIQWVKPLFEEAGIPLEARIENIREVQVELDKDQIKQVILNLLLNALEAQKEEVKSVAPILVEGIKTSKGIGFAVLDHGPGIAENQLGEIFNPFFTTKEKGTGLGLSIVYRILEQHHGRITLTNRVNGGIRAEVIFPQKRYNDS